MDKRAKIFTYIAIAVILVVLVCIAVVTKFSGGAPNVTAYAEKGTTANCVMGGYTWNTMLKKVIAESNNFLEFQYANENTLLVKPGERITFRNSGKDFDTYKFEKEYVKYYDKDGNEVEVAEPEKVVIKDSKSLTIEAPANEGTYICEMKLIYSNKGEVEYGMKIVVSSTPSYKIESLIKYKGLYIGDNTKVVNLIDALPYSEYGDGLILRTAKEPYELIIYYKGLAVEKEKLLNNSVALFALITNVDVITYQLDDNTIIYTRKELEIKYGRDLRVYADDVDLWKKEVLYNERPTDMIGASKIYKEILTRSIDGISKSDYIAIDLASFETVGMTGLADISKSEILRALANDGRVLVETNKDEAIADEKFKGVIIYATSFKQTENGSEIEVEKYYSKNRQEKLVYSISSDGVVIEK